jgi:hypothetical protein
MTNGEAIDSWNVLAHWASAGALIGSITHFIPPLVALVPAIFYTMQIYRLPEVQNWFKKRRLRRIEKLRSKIRDLESQG